MCLSGSSVAPAGPTRASRPTSSIRAFSAAAAAGRSPRQRTLLYAGSAQNAVPVQIVWPLTIAAKCLPSAADTTEEVVLGALVTFQVMPPSLDA